jgi:hypothetical protein
MKTIFFPVMQAITKPHILLPVTVGLFLSGCSVGMAINEAMEDLALYARDGYVDPCKKFPPLPECTTAAVRPTDVAPAAPSQDEEGSAEIPLYRSGSWRVRQYPAIGSNTTYTLSGTGGSTTFRVKTYTPIGKNRQYRVTGPDSTTNWRVKKHPSIGNSTSYTVHGPDGAATYRVKRYPAIGNSQKIEVRGPDGTRTIRVKTDRNGNIQSIDSR